MCKQQPALKLPLRPVRQEWSLPRTACVRARVCADQAQGVLALLGELVNSNFVWAGGVRHFVQMGNDLTGA